MKLTSGIFIIVLWSLVATAQTNNLTALLQQGLFEEQASRNLDAAIASYQSLARQYDQDRQLAATAVFRLGECYRAQGKTNEATAQYQRILHEFSDQATLAALSRQNLAGMGLMEKASGVADTASLPINSSADTSSEEDQEIARLKQMIQNSPDLINRATSDNGTPLFSAARKDQLRVAAFLLDHGADINAPAGTHGKIWDIWTPLEAAADSGHKAMTELLLRHGADVNTKDVLDGTALHQAALHGFQSVIEVLLAGHADVNALNISRTTPLFNAVQSGNVNIVKLLLDAGANANLKDGQGRTVLNYAIGTSPQIIRALLVAGANPNTEDSAGRSPLSYAVERNTLNVVKLLLDAKADANGGHKDAPLLIAIYKHNPAAAEMLLQAGADPHSKSMIDCPMQFGNGNYANGTSITPLFLGIIHGQLPLVQLLLKFKADPDDAQTDGRAAIFSALGNPDILKALLDAGAKVDVVDETDTSHPDGPSGSFLSRLNQMNNPDLKRTPLLFATGESNVVAVTQLINHGANPNATDGRANTALHYAAMWLADDQVFTQLLKHQANPNWRNIDGKTPLDLVKERLGISIHGSRFLNQNQFGVTQGEVSPAQMSQVEKLITLLRQHGALDNLPDWDRITIRRPSTKASVIIFQKGTNDWNHFTLLELIYSANERLDHFPFPDLAGLVIVRPASNGREFRRIPVNLLNSTNGVDCSHDQALEFGDVVEIPEREHSLAEGNRFLSRDAAMTILNHFRNQTNEAKLVVANQPAIQLPLQPFFCGIGEVLSRGTALATLTSSSDLSRVKVMRRDPITRQTATWMVDCRNLNNQGTPDLWLRNGDVIEVPEKP